MMLLDFIIIYLVSIAVVTVFWAAYIRVHNGSRFAKTALLLCAALCFYILGYAMELNSASESQILFWNHVEYIGIPFVSALWLSTALLYTGLFGRHKVLLTIAIFAIPVVTLVLRYTNDYHHLYFASTSFVEALGKPFFIKQSGVWMYVQTVHSMSMILVSMALLIRDAVKSGERHPGKIWMTALASLFAVAGLILMQVRPFGYPIDYMALCLPITALLVIIAIARFDLLEAKSVARSRAFQFNANAVLLVNRGGRIIDYHTSARHLFERLGVRLRNESLAALLAGSPELLAGIQNLEKNVVELQLDGDDRFYEIQTTNIDERTLTRGWIKTIRDVTEVHRLGEELKRQAITDELSQLNNRRAFLQIGREWVARSVVCGKPLYLAMFDIDFFKAVNDRYGHSAGDMVIREFGRMLRQSFAGDSIVARLGGEEFVCLQSGGEDAATQQALKDFLETVRGHTFLFRGKPIHITLSVGLTKLRAGQSLEGLMRSVDQALYRSKDAGRDRITVLF
jgi:diguanylate cyclase (GGDEF)-like protein